MFYELSKHWKILVHLRINCDAVGGYRRLQEILEGFRNFYDLHCYGLGGFRRP